MEEKMEFTQYKCPVCKKQFVSGDDIVVCPECGAPHHRECYEQNGKCFFEDKHSEDFSFENYSAVHGEKDSADNLCPVCKFQNESGALFCSRCGCPLHDKQNSNDKNRQDTEKTENTEQTPPPFGFGTAGAYNFDPLAGLDSNEEVADDIKVGEMAKFVGKNTNYFLTVFNRVRKFGRAKFNFSALVFPGIYFLYRKMYLLGIIFTLIIIGANVTATYIKLTPEYYSAYTEVSNFVYSKAYLTDSAKAFSMLGKVGLLYIPEILEGIRYVIMIFSGFLANRLYLNHCKKRINKIREESNGENIDDRLTSKGGVNLALAISFGVAYIAITLICNYILLTSY